MLYVTLGQHIEITEIPQGNGFTLIRGDQVPIIQNFSKVIHVINLQRYDDIIASIENTTSAQITEKFSIIPLLIEKIKAKLFTLEPHRIKRTIFSPYGSFLKWFGGVMDDNDRQFIDGNFDKIELNMKSFVANNEKQIAINSRIDESIQKLASHINEQQEIVISKFNILSNSLNKRLVELETFRVIKENLQMISDSIEEIENIVLLSRLEILGRNILTIEEIRQYQLDEHEHEKS